MVAIVPLARSDLVTILHAASGAEDPKIRLDYQPGACNIGPAEIARRRRIGHSGLAAALGLLAVLVVVDAPPSARLSILLPASAAAIGYLQAHSRFCAAFGFRGVFNFGQVGQEQQVARTASAASDRRRALQLTAAAVGFGMVAGISAALLPL
jgi:hypothetical protein